VGEGKCAKLEGENTHGQVATHVRRVVACA